MTREPDEPAHAAHAHQIVAATLTAACVANEPGKFTKEMIYNLYVSLYWKVKEEDVNPRQIPIGKTIV